MKKNSISKSRGSSRGLRFLIYGGIFLIFGLFVTAVAIPVFSNPTFCGTVCHSMRPEYEAWKKSSHANITCYACHIEPGLFILFEDKLVAGLTGVIDEYTGNYEKPINADSKLSQEGIKNEVCDRCHNISARNFTYSQGLGMNHEPHLKLHLRCTTCHNRVAHLDIGNYDKGDNITHRYRNFMDMEEGCYRCHRESKPYRTESGKTAPTSCPTCHPYCSDCHVKGLTRIAPPKEKSFCIRCHGANNK